MVRMEIAMGLAGIAVQTPVGTAVTPTMAEMVTREEMARTVACWF
jgi:hypothetical protein